MIGVNLTKIVMVLKTIGTIVLVLQMVQKLTLGVALMRKTMAAAVETAAVAPTTLMAMASPIQTMHVQTNMLMLKMTLIMTAVLMMTEGVETVTDPVHPIQMEMVLRMATIVVQTHLLAKAWISLVAVIVKMVAATTATATTAVATTAVATTAAATTAVATTAAVASEAEAATSMKDVFQVVLISMKKPSSVPISPTQMA